MKRYFDRVEAARKRVCHASIDRLELRSILGEFHRRPHDSRPEIFGEKSLFSKCLKHTLTPEQSSRFQQVMRDRAQSRHRSTISWVLGAMDTTLQLRAEQHRRLEELLVKETRPPRRFGEYDYYGIMFQVSRLPESSLRPIFDDSQWAKLRLQLAEANRLEQTLKDEGFLPDDQVADAASGPRPQSALRPVQPRS
jgi:hypothetical protein